MFRLLHNIFFINLILLSYTVQTNAGLFSFNNAPPVTVVCKDLVSLAPITPNFSKGHSHLSKENARVFIELGIVNGFQYINGLIIYSEMSVEVLKALKEQSDISVTEDSLIPESEKNNAQKVAERYQDFLNDSSIEYLTQIPPAWKRLLFGSAIAERKEANVEIKLINDNIGFGVYALNEIKKGDFLGIYSGEIRNTYEPPKIRSNYRFGFGTNTPELNGWVIDAKEAGNFTRFVSHSYNPNVDQVSVFHNGLYYIVFVANQDIPVEQQLFIDYGRAYWQSRNVEPVEMNPLPQN